MTMTPAQLVATARRNLTRKGDPPPSDSDVALLLAKCCILYAEAAMNIAGQASSGHHRDKPNGVGTGIEIKNDNPNL
jgi:hypothetical protein